MKPSRFLVLAALAWAEPFMAWSDDTVDAETGRRSTGRVLLEETSASSILLDTPDSSVGYSRGEVTANRLLGFVSEYGELGVRPPDLYEPNANLLLLFADLFEYEIHEDPFYLFGKEDVDRSIFPYEEQAWNSFGSALRRKYKIVRSADRAIRKVQEVTTLSYQARSGMTFQVRPAIEDITNSEKIRVRVACLNLPGVDKIEAKIGQSDLKVTVGKRTFFLGRLTIFQLIYEGLESTDDSLSRYENVGELTLSIPFW